MSRMLSKPELWQRFLKHYKHWPTIHLSLDLSRMTFGDVFISSMESPMQKAFAAMVALEKGAIANPDENRMVGHYWLRNPALAPTNEIKQEIIKTLDHIKAFTEKVHRGDVRGQSGPFKNMLLIGIGGSALGPQFVSHALSDPQNDRLQPYFFDNTDPDGMDRVLKKLGPELGQTLAITISKSGGTKETRNGMLEAKSAYEGAGLDFAKHSIAVTSANSQLDKIAIEQGWLDRFPMWDWVGGRTSELSGVGLLPAALQGFDIDGLLEGARACDEVTRKPEVTSNPAAQLALMWYWAGNGKGTKNLVILPYKDRLELFSKYLQQLIMESLGKELDLNGKKVNQGLSVFGNKGATDQHSYIQQLRDGLDNFFATFIEVLKDRVGPSPLVEPYVTTGDFLSGFLLGTRQALYENGRESITITVNEVNGFTIGVLIALFERTVGLYASLIGINPYHQPGVEAGKKGAAAVIDLQCRILKLFEQTPNEELGVEAIAKRIAADEVETVFKICEHLSANLGLARIPGESILGVRYRKA